MLHASMYSSERLIALDSMVLQGDLSIIHVGNHVYHAAGT